MKLSQRLLALLLIILLSFVVYGAWSFKVLNNLKVNGPVYQRIVQGKDLIADILPPPEYIIESYLVTCKTRRAICPKWLASSGWTGCRQPCRTSARMLHF